MAHPGTHHHLSTHDEQHRSHRAGWLRAAVLGANDGLVSTACLVVGMAASGASAPTVRTAGIAGLVAGALSMAVGEYVSVASQRDTEEADLAIERQALEDHPHQELEELTAIYVGRGLAPDLAGEVARQLTAADALGAHARDEIGLTPTAAARPLQAAWSSGLAFTTGALVPVLTFHLAPAGDQEVVVFAVALLALALLGVASAALGGARRGRSVTRVAVGGLLAMAVTLGVGAATGSVVG
jgi:VIT1/CCC1 family predicted Fe2+/Mn2+ transporter